MSKLFSDRFSQCADGRLSRGAIEALVLVGLLCLSASFLGCKARSPELNSDASETVDKPLTNFSHDITSSVHALTLSPGEVFRVPVTIKNPTAEVWASAGKYPVLVSYMWFDKGVMLPPDSERTMLPSRVPPGGSVAVTVKGTAPQKGQKLLLRITLVQEGVAWFMVKGALALEIPVELKQ
jgi:hypothetical protein